MGYSHHLKHLNMTLILLVGLSDFQSSCNTWLEIGPTNKAVIEGQRTSFICDLNDNSSGSVYWKHVNVSGHRRFISYNYYIYPLPDRNLSHYEIIIDISRQRYELVLKAVSTLRDSGVYECGCMTCPTNLASANLTVLPKNFSHTCEIWKLPARETDPFPEFELSCFWYHVKVLEVHFEDVDGYIIQPDINFPHRIISRVLSPPVQDFVCSIALYENISPITAKCRYGYGDKYFGNGIVRVDPFINKIPTRSNASFTCSVANESHQAHMSWNLTDAYETKGNRSPGRVVESTHVLLILNVTAADESLLIGCQVSLPGHDVVWSYAGLQVVESTTIWTTRLSHSSSHGTQDQASKADQMTRTTTGQYDQEIQPITGNVVKDVDRDNNWTMYTVITTTIIAFLALLSVIILGVRHHRVIQRRYDPPNAATKDAAPLPVDDKTSLDAHQLSLSSDGSPKYHEIGKITATLNTSDKSSFNNDGSPLFKLISREITGIQIPDSDITGKYEQAIVTANNESRPKEPHDYSKKIYRSNEDFYLPCIMDPELEGIPLNESTGCDKICSENLGSPERSPFRSVIETNFKPGTDIETRIYQNQCNPTYEEIPDNVGLCAELVKYNKQKKENQCEEYLVPIENLECNGNAGSQEIVHDNDLKKSISGETVSEHHSLITECDLLDVGTVSSVSGATLSLVDSKCDIKTPKCSVDNLPSDFSEDPSELDHALDMKIDDPFFNLTQEAPTCSVK